MAKAKSKPEKVEIPEVKTPDVEETEVEKVSENKKEVEKVSENKTKAVETPKVEIEKVEKVPTNMVRCKVIKDIPNLFIVNKRYAHRKGESPLIDSYHAQRLRDGGYIQ